MFDLLLTSCILQEEIVELHTWLLLEIVELHTWLLLKCWTSTLLRRRSSGRLYC